MLQAQKMWCIVPAAGLGARMGADIPKQYLPLQGKMLIQHTLHALLSYPHFHQVIVALDAQDTHFSTVRQQFCKQEQDKCEVVIGGQTRCHSVYLALGTLAPIANKKDWVLVHDAARPCLRHADINQLVCKLQQDPVGGLLGIPVADALQKVKQGQVICGSDRDNLWRAQTPQMFRYGVLRLALEKAIACERYASDEASAIVDNGGVACMVMGNPCNIKVTYPGDLFFAQCVLQSYLEGDDGKV